jgi:hypothetical protein
MALPALIENLGGQRCVFDGFRADIRPSSIRNALSVHSHAMTNRNRKMSVSDEKCSWFRRTSRASTIAVLALLASSFGVHAAGVVFEEPLMPLEGSRPSDRQPDELGRGPVPDQGALLGSKAEAFETVIRLLEFEHYPVDVRIVFEIFHELPEDRAQALSKNISTLLEDKSISTLLKEKSSNISIEATDSEKKLDGTCV